MQDRTFVTKTPVSEDTRDVSLETRLGSRLQFLVSVSVFASLFWSRSQQRSHDQTFGLDLDANSSVSTSIWRPTKFRSLLVSILVSECDVTCQSPRSPVQRGDQDIVNDRRAVATCMRSWEWGVLWLWVLWVMTRSIMMMSMSIRMLCITTRSRTIA